MTACVTFSRDLSAVAPVVASADVLCFSNDADIQLLRTDLGPIDGSYLRGWLDNVAYLDCTALTRLTAVGNCWLRHCTRLTALDCTGLTQLASSATIGFSTAPA